jgi:predicted O-methyltransferase YrrM
MLPAEHECLLGALRAAAGAGQFLEIGTAAGGTLAQMMLCLDRQDARFVVVDPMTYFPDQLQAVQRNLRGHGIDPARVDFRVQTSARAFAAAKKTGESFRFILIDGSHKIMPVMGDLRWLRLLATDGVVCFHDYWPGEKGVYLPVKRFLSRRSNYKIVGSAAGLLALRKTGPSLRVETDLADWLYACGWYLPLQVTRKLAKFRER